jgi:hypothetical protein
VRRKCARIQSVREKSVEGALSFLWGVLLYNFSTSEETQVQLQLPVYHETIRGKIAKYKHCREYMNEALKMENAEVKV